MKDFEKNLFKVQKFLKQNSHVSADICTLKLAIMMGIYYLPWASFLPFQ